MFLSVMTVSVLQFTMIVITDPTPHAILRTNSPKQTSELLHTLIVHMRRISAMTEHFPRQTTRVDRISETRKD
jgi:hypothetical protein